MPNNRFIMLITSIIIVIILCVSMYIIPVSNIFKEKAAMGYLEQAAKTKQTQLEEIDKLIAKNVIAEEEIAFVNKNQFTTLQIKELENSLSYSENIGYTYSGKSLGDKLFYAKKINSQPALQMYQKVNYPQNFWLQSNQYYFIGYSNSKNLYSLEIYNQPIIKIFPEVYMAELLWLVNNNYQYIGEVQGKYFYTKKDSNNIPYVKIYSTPNAEDLKWLEQNGYGYVE